MKLYLLLAAVLSRSAFSKCPNSCSGHGTCNQHDQCTCFLEDSSGVIYLTSDEAYAGTCFAHKTATPCNAEASNANYKCKWDTDDECKYITKDDTTFSESSRYGLSAHSDWKGADCSRRTCPRGTSWTEIAAFPNGKTFSCLHTVEVECSDQGNCDRATGLCNCYPGFQGHACQRTSCPDDCSGHGTCRSNRDFAYDFAVAKTHQLLQTHLSTELFQENYRATYDDAWDTNLIYGCKCDIGYRGANCAMVECPSFDDPLDEKCPQGEDATHKKDATSLLENFQVQKFAPTGAAGWSKAYATSRAEEELTPDLLCKTSANNANQALCEATIGSNGERCVFHAPNQCLRGDKNYQFYSGKVYSCYGAMAGMDCSGRGICDYRTGQCSCFSGYTGTACNDVEDLA